MFKLLGSEEEEDPICYLKLEEDGGYGVTVWAVNKDGSQIGAGRIVSFTLSGKLKLWGGINGSAKGISLTEIGRIEIEEVE